MYNGLYNPKENLENYLSNPDNTDKDKIDRLKSELDSLNFSIQFMNNPREKYQNFLLQARQVDVANIDKYIVEEIDRMKAELER